VLGANDRDDIAEELGVTSMQLSGGTIPPFVSRSLIAG